MKKIINALYIILGLLIIAGLIWVVYSMVQFVINLNTELGKAIIAGCFTLLAAAIGVALTKYFEEKNKILFQIREKKIPIYEKLISFYIELLNAEKAGKKKPSSKEVAKFMMDFTSDLIVWGSDEVIDAWVKARRFSLEKSEEQDSAIRLLALLENLMLAIRKDLGHKNKNLDKSHAVLGTFINDLAQHVSDLDEIKSED